MKEATRYANDIAKLENEESLAKVKASGKTQIITLTADEKKAVWPWLLTMLVFLLAVTYVPAISLALPKALGML